jgi:hypothetical protein
MTNIRTLQLSREMWIFLGVTSLMSVVYLYKTTPLGPVSTSWNPTPAVHTAGETIDLALTLVTADAFGLACSSDGNFDGAHCAFDKGGEPWKPKAGETPKPADVLMPYMTVDNVLFVIPGLWEQPILKKRLEDEPPARIPVEERENHRFTASCKMKVDKKIEGFQVRWAPTGAWSPRDSAWIGRVSDCKITG